MALTRKWLKTLGIDDGQIEQIIAAHADTVTALKTEISTARSQSDELTSVATHRDALQQQLDALATASDDAARIQADYDAYKAQVEAERTLAVKHRAVLDALNAHGIHKAAPTIARAIDLSALAIEDGTVANLDAFIDTVVAEHHWAVETTTVHGVPPIAPPTGNARSIYTRADIERMSADEINQNWAAIQASLPNIKGV